MHKDVNIRLQGDPMSIKSSLLLAGLFLILNSYSASIGAKSDISAENEFENAQTRSHMKPLFDHKKATSLSEETIQPHTDNLLLKVQDALKTQDIENLFTPSLELNTLIDEYNILQLAHRIGFSLTEKNLSPENELSPVDAKETSKLRTTLKESSFIEKIEKALLKMSPDLQSHHWNQMLD